MQPSSIGALLPSARRSMESVPEANPTQVARTLDGVSNSGAGMQAAAVDVISMAELFKQLRDPGLGREEHLALIQRAAAGGVPGNINAQEGKGAYKWPLLHFAIDLGDIKAFEALLKAPYIQLGTKDKAGLSPLHLAAQQGRPEFVAALIAACREKFPGGEQKEKVAAFVNATNGAMRTPLHLAATANNNAVEIMQCLIDNGACVDPQTKAGGSTPLAYAVKGYLENREERIKAAQYLIARGADPNIEILKYPQNRPSQASGKKLDKMLERTTPLTIAKENGWGPMVEALSLSGTAPGSMAPESGPDWTGGASPSAFGAVARLGRQLGSQEPSASQPAMAAVADNTSAVSLTPVRPDWLTEDGAIKYGSLSYKEILGRLVMAEDGVVSKALLKDYAENFCDEHFEQYDIYDSSDPYYTLKDLARRRIVIDYDHQDLMDHAWEACVEQRHDFFESTVAPALVECIEGYRSDRSAFSLDEAFDDLKSIYDAELNGWALQIMEDVALKAASSSDSDSD